MKCLPFDSGSLFVGRVGRRHTLFGPRPRSAATGPVSARTRSESRVSASILRHNLCVGSVLSYHTYRTTYSWSLPCSTPRPRHSRPSRSRQGGGPSVTWVEPEEK